MNATEWGIVHDPAATVTVVCDENVRQLSPSRVVSQLWIVELEGGPSAPGQLQETRWEMFLPVDWGLSVTTVRDSVLFEGLRVSTVTMSRP